MFFGSFSCEELLYLSLPWMEINVSSEAGANGNVCFTILLQKSPFRSFPFHGPCNWQLFLADFSVANEDGSKGNTGPKLRLQISGPREISLWSRLRTTLRGSWLHDVMWPRQTELQLSDWHRKKEILIRSFHQRKRFSWHSKWPLYK